jgi:UDP-GlcNAc:undecaprenyl-phosphate GlcNAc-1-phosphate transferase
MYSLLFLAVTSFALALILTPCVRELFRRLGIVDVPDNARKLHGRPIPRVGGIAIALSFIFPVVVLPLMPLHSGRTLPQSSLSTGKLISSAAVIFFIGFLDDLIRLKPWHKLAGQIAAALLAYLAGIRVLGTSGTASSPWWILPVTVFWLVACCNAINLIDGMDGLAAGVSFIATAAMLFAAALQHNMLLAFVTAPLAGCLLGFLRYNFSPASVFLGDCGSLFIGFLLGCFGAIWSGKCATVLGMTSPLLALSVPLADTGLAVLRRFLRGEPIFKGDRGHVHYRLLDLDFTPRKATLILYGVCTLAAIFSLCIENRYLKIPILFLFGIAICLSVRGLDYVEFAVIARLLAQGSFRRLVSSKIALRDFEATLAAANSASEFWHTLRNSQRAFGLSQIHMRLLGQTYFSQHEAGGVRGVCCLFISLTDGDFIELLPQTPTEKGDFAVAFISILAAVLEVKRPIFLSRAQPVETRYVLSHAASAGH